MSLRRTITSKVQTLLQRVPDAGGEGTMSEDPTRNFEAFFKHLRRLGFSPEVCIDVGAAVGTREIYEAFPSSKHLVFEPLPDFQAELKNALEPYDYVLHDCVLSDEAGEVTLLRHSELFGSSIMHRRNEQDERVMKVKASTLDKEVDLADVNGPVFLKTDCQGSDLLVLKGGIETMKYCEVIVVEASLFRFWGQHQPDLYDIITFMKSEGFVLYDILDGLFRPLDSALGQVDLAFVKDGGVFRKQHYW